MIGMGLRHIHFSEILTRLENEKTSLGVDFFEIITENFFQTKGRPFRVLEKIREHFDISFHGVSLSIASCEEINFEYLKAVKNLENIINPILISDHLCFTGMSNNNLHNLLPFPYNEESLRHVAEKILKVQDFLKRPLILENLSAYISFKNSNMSEADFLVELHRQTGCFILLDLNNVFVNSYNQNFSAQQFIDKIPARAVKEMHLAGFTDMGTHYFDTHSCPVWDPVWTLFKDNYKKFQFVSTVIEWDENIPAYDTVQAEVEKAKLIARKHESN